MRGRTGIPKRHHQPAPSTLILFAILFAGCVAISQAVTASALVRSKTRLPKTAAATAAPVAEAAALIRQQQSQQSKQEAEERADNAEEIVLVDEEESATSENATTKSPLTGVPQVDYKLDPNLPRELNGFNLSDYPFYNAVPEEIDFKCDGLHDGFYASVQHKCQLYHHCLNDQRYDFLCANYTAFDQKTFICHFVSEVDCVNSPKYFKRNEALYKQDTTTTSSTTTTTTPAPPPRERERDRDSGGRRGGSRRRPRPRRPAFDDDDEFYDDEYDEYEDEPPARRERNRKRRPNNRQREKHYDDDFEATAPKTKSAPKEEPPLPSKPNKAVFEQPRKPPIIKPPVPLSEKDKYARPGDDAPPEKPAKGAEEYYDEEEEQTPKKTKRPHQQEAGSYEEEDFRRTPPLGANGRPLRRNRPSRRRRPSMRPYYDDEDEYRDDYRPMRKRPYNRRPAYDDYEDDPPPRSRKPSRQRQREYDDEYEVEEHEKRPAKKSTTTSTTTTTTTTTTTPKPTTKRPKPSTTTVQYEDEEYYEDEFYEDDEPVVKKPQIADAVAAASSTSTTTTSTTTTPSTRRPFLPKVKPTTSAPDTSLKFNLKSPTELESEREFSIDDYVKPSTRAPFVPASKSTHKSEASVTTSTTTTTTPAPALTIRSRQQVKSRVPIESDYEDIVQPQNQPQFMSRNPTKQAEFTSSAQVPSRTPSRGTLKQVAPTFSSPEADLKPARFPARNKPAAPVPDFTSPGEEEDEYRTIRKPETIIASKTPSPPPRSRLSTSFLPRGLSPVGGARVKPTPAPALPLQYEDEEDEAFNDALHPTGAEDSASTVSYVPLQRQSQNRLPPIRGSQQRLGGDNSGARTQSSFSSRVPEYDDESEPSAPSAPASRTGSFQSRQQYQQVPPSGFDAYQRQPTSSATSNSYRPQSRQSAPRGNRPLATAASTAQYQGWSRDYYFPTY